MTRFVAPPGPTVPMQQGSRSAETARLLTRCGLRVTTARVRILDVLTGHEGMAYHDVCRALEQASIALPPGTVHRVLCDLCARGLIRREGSQGTPGVKFCRPHMAGTSSAASTLFDPPPAPAAPRR